MTVEELTALQLQHPTWNIRRPKDAPYVIATRSDRTHLTDKELYAGLCMTLIENTPDILTETLSLQSKIERTLWPSLAIIGASLLDLFALAMLAAFITIAIHDTPGRHR